METREEVIRGEINRINAAIDETRERYGNQFAETVDGFSARRCRNHDDQRMAPAGFGVAVDQPEECTHGVRWSGAARLNTLPAPGTSADRHDEYVPLRLPTGYTARERWNAAFMNAGSWCQ